MSDRDWKQELEAIEARFRDEVEENAYLHNEDCSCMMEDPDACDCSNIEYVIGIFRKHTGTLLHEAIAEIERLRKLINTQAAHSNAWKVVEKNRDLEMERDALTAKLTRIEALARACRKAQEAYWDSSQSGTFDYDLQTAAYNAQEALEEILGGAR